MMLKHGVVAVAAHVVVFVEERVAVEGHIQRKQASQLLRVKNGQ